MNENKIQGHIIRPFSPAIGKYKIPQKTIDVLNDFIDQILKDEKKIEDNYYGNQLAGEIKFELKLSNDFINQNLYQLLKDYVFNFVKSTTRKELKTFEIISSWAVCQFESDYNPVHWHNGHISGVMYTKMPKDFGSSYKKDNWNGNIAFLQGATQFTSTGAFRAKPEIGDLYLFPSNMMHTVYPFFSSEERRSISFNAFLDEETVKI